MKIKTVICRKGELSGKTMDGFLDRPAFDSMAESTAAKVLSDIRKDGDKAILKYARRFDGLDLTAGRLKVTASEIRSAWKQVDKRFIKAAKETFRRVTAFAKSGMRKNWSMKTENGGTLGEQFVPFERVGVYVPGGKAPLASTALMTAPLAKVAGVKEIVACTPCGKDGKVNPYLLVAIDIAGANEVYRVGGIQSIGMMAFGTKSVKKVQKIVGPGGPYVTAAKRQVYGNVALDLVAGPSEIAVLADDSADPAFVAADLLSQAEHGTGAEKVLFVTTSRKIADSVVRQLDRQASTLSREKAVRKVMQDGMLIVIVKDIGDGAEICNRFAPEHLELAVRNPRAVLPKIRCAGAIFLGKWTPESAGDFVAGPSHVLPTGGAAAMFSGLTVDDFRRRSSLIEFTEKDLKKALPVIEMFGKIEGLDAHSRSASLRFK